MARSPSPGLTEGETRIMNVLWSKGTATVAEVASSLLRTPPVAYNTVQTMLRILETKGYVAHEQNGRAFVYRPLVEQRTARRRALGHLLDAFFDSSPSLLVSDVLRDERLGADEVERLKRMIGEV